MNYKLSGNKIYFGVPNKRVHDGNNSRPWEIKAFGYSIFNDTLFIHPYVCNNFELFYHQMVHVSKIVFENSNFEINRSQFNRIFLPSPSIKQIVFNDNFNVSFTSTPYITHLSFGDKFNQPIVLNSSVVYVYFGSFFNQPVKISKNLAILYIGINFSKKLDLNKHLKILRSGKGCYFVHKLSKNLKYLDLNRSFNDCIDLPKHLIWLYVHEKYVQTIKLTPNIKYLMIQGSHCNNIIGKCYSNDICLHIFAPQPSTNDNLPNNVKHITYQFTPSFNNIPNKTNIYFHCKNYSDKMKKFYKRHLSEYSNFVYIPE